MFCGRYLTAEAADDTEKKRKTIKHKNTGGDYVQGQNHNLDT
jgi:hypothetical protein